jgi:hypothetical protein
MPWLVEYTDDFGAWWETLRTDAQDDIAAVVSVLEQRGPQLPFPYSSAIAGSRHGHMRELRVQSGGDPLRIFYAFDRRQQGRRRSLLRAHDPARGSALR